MKNLSSYKCPKQCEEQYYEVENAKNKENWSQNTKKQSLKALERIEKWLKLQKTH